MPDDSSVVKLRTSSRRASWPQLPAEKWLGATSAAVWATLVPWACSTAPSQKFRRESGWNITLFKNRLSLQEEHWTQSLETSLKSRRLVHTSSRTSTTGSRSRVLITTEQLDSPLSCGQGRKRGFTCKHLFVWG